MGAVVGPLRLGSVHRQGSLAWLIFPDHEWRSVIVSRCASSPAIRRPIFNSRDSSLLAPAPVFPWAKRPKRCVNSPRTWRLLSTSSSTFTIYGLAPGVHLREKKKEGIMKIKDRMVKSVSVCRPEDNLAEVTAMMWEGRCGALPVLDAEEGVISMITDRDVCIALGTRNLRASDVNVKDVAPSRVFVCLDSDDISYALKTMVSQNVRRLPVINNEGKLVGIILIDDFLLHSEPGKAGILSLEVLEALKTIIENRQRG